MQKDLEIIHFTLDDNPNISQETKKQIIDSQKGVYYQKYILGLWVVAEGAIYKDSWDDKYLYDDSKRPVGLYGGGGYTNHVIGVDYGTHNPCVFLEYFDDGEVSWLDREYYWDSVKEMRQKTDGEYADDMEVFISTSRAIGRRNPCIVVDPTATSFKLELVKRGLWVVDANNDVLSGIHRVSEVEATGHRRVREDCTQWRREKALYAWDSDAALDKGVERPLKINDHTQDADRYAIQQLFPEWRTLYLLEA
jgi:PBSX family phage terminase large subunit